MKSFLTPLYLNFIDFFEEAKGASFAQKIILETIFLLYYERQDL